jgi:transposase-like protein
MKCPECNNIMDDTSIGDGRNDTYFCEKCEKHFNLLGDEI